MATGANMTYLPENKSTIENHLDCFGDFDPEDMICRSHCALSIRCCIERNESLRMELLEDLISSDMANVRIQ